jgi:hypothetical protein
MFTNHSVLFVTFLVASYYIYKKKKIEQPTRILSLGRLEMLTRAILATSVTYLGLSRPVFFLLLLPPIQNYHEVGNQVPVLPQVTKLCSQATIFWTMSGHDMSFVLTDILHQQSQSVLSNLPSWKKLTAKACRPKRILNHFLEYSIVLSKMLLCLPYFPLLWVSWLNFKNLDPQVIFTIFFLHRRFPIVLQYSSRIWITS